MGETNMGILLRTLPLSCDRKLLLLPVGRLCKPSDYFKSTVSCEIRRGNKPFFWKD
jgi:hypothetical protein